MTSVEGKTCELSWTIELEAMRVRDVVHSSLILLVDDDFDRQQQTSHILREAGYSVIEAFTAGEAVALFDANPSVALVIARVVLQDESGVHVANHVAESERGAETLLVSHFSRDLLRYVPGFCEHEHYLPNPFTAEVLISRVKRLLPKRR